MILLKPLKPLTLGTKHLTFYFILNNVQNFKDAAWQFLRTQKALYSHLTQSHQLINDPHHILILRTQCEITVSDLKWAFNTESLSFISFFSARYTSFSCGLWLSFNEITLYNLSCLWSIFF